MDPRSSTEVSNEPRWLTLKRRFIDIACNLSAGQSIGNMARGNGPSMPVHPQVGDIARYNSWAASCGQPLWDHYRVAGPAPASVELVCVREGSCKRKVSNFSVCEHMAQGHDEGCGRQMAHGNPCEGV